jgi:hypothetical protein
VSNFFGSTYSQASAELADIDPALSMKLSYAIDTIAISAAEALLCGQNATSFNTDNVQMTTEKSMDLLYCHSMI